MGRGGRPVRLLHRCHPSVAAAEDLDTQTTAPAVATPARRRRRSGRREPRHDLLDAIDAAGRLSTETRAISSRAPAAHPPGCRSMQSSRWGSWSGGLALLFSCVFGDSSGMFALERSRDYLRLVLLIWRLKEDRDRRSRRRRDR